MYRYSLIITALLVLSDLSLYSQVIWEQTKGPVGGQINSVAEISGDKIISASKYGVFISTNAGETWNNGGLTDLHVRCVSSDPAGNIFAGMYGSGGVYRSTNDGEDWIQSGLENEGVLCIKIFTDDIYAGLGNYYSDTGGLYRSVDSGSSWTYLGFLNNSVRDVAINEYGDIFAAVYDGIYKSTNNGTSWSEVLQIYNTSSIEIKANGKIFLCNGTDDVWRSTDNGDTWEQLNQGFGLYNPQLLSVHIDQNIYALSEHYNFLSGFRGVKIFRSTNDGDSWEETGQNDLEASVNSFMITSNGKTYVGTYWDGVFRSSDSGVNWSQINDGLYAMTVNALDIDSQGKIYAGTYGNSLFYSIDNGENWENIRVALNSRYIFGLLLINDQILMVTTNSGVYLSMDGGVNWDYRGLQYSNTHDLLINSGGDLFVSSLSEGIYFSPDLGETWSAVNNGLTTDNISALAITTDQHIFAGTNTGIFRSTDNGQSWVRKSNGLNNNPTFEVIATSENVLYAGSPFGKIYKSTNDGESWISKSNGLPSSMINTLLEVQNIGIYAGTNEGVYFSSNEGENWIQLNSGLISHKIYSLKLDNEKHLLGATAQGVVRTVDQVSSVRFTNNEIPCSSSLLQNYPNPFNPSTIINYQLTTISFVKLRVYNTLGEETAVLVNQEQPAGNYEVEWDATGLPSGIYFYQLQSDGFVETKKMILMK